jgi:hypothetical protein
LLALLVVITPAPARITALVVGTVIHKAAARVAEETTTLVLEALVVV